MEKDFILDTMWGMFVVVSIVSGAITAIFYFALRSDLIPILIGVAISYGILMPLRWKRIA
ncbi:hypothetical protein LCGC14_1368320 [marine sediment metagenome]|uniref:Uncharacterized protein n=1 Tax=marine sediment metagenome TaxID=412755 RepID=A0A0F9KS37_9ZZZZ